jgi:hypothetical protein
MHVRSTLANSSIILLLVFVFILAIHCQACKKRANEFASKSTSGGLLLCVVGCIDGKLFEIDCPHDVPNPRSYYSGHKQAYGINVQAICDAYCRIMLASMNTPGAVSFFFFCKPN